MRDITLLHFKNWSSSFTHRTQQFTQKHTCLDAAGRWQAGCVSTLQASSFYHQYEYFRRCVKKEPAKCDVHPAGFLIVPSVCENERVCKVQQAWPAGVGSVPHPCTQTQST